MEMETYEFQCMYCGKRVTAELPPNGARRKFCGSACSSAYWSRERSRNYYSAKAAGTQAKRKEQTASKPLVSEDTCRKCAYSVEIGSSLGCNYFEITERTKTAQHPEGLTADCQEFKPRKRERKKKAKRTEE